MIVYIYTFPDGKKYIGQTVNSLNVRAGKEGNGYYNSPAVYEAIKEFGWNNIQKEYFECNSVEEMDDLERELIAFYHTQDRKFGYNIDPGGHKQHFRSEETKKKISEAQQGEKNSFYGKHHSEEAKKKIGEASKNRPPLSEEARERISFKNSGRKHTQEEKQKMRENSGQAKKVKCLETGIIYCSAAEAARQNNCDVSSLRKVCNHVKNFNTCKGYHWEWATEE